MAAKTTTREKTKAAQEVVADMHREGLGNLAGLNTAMLETFSDMSAEMGKFIAQRFEEDVRVQHELLQCKSLKDIQSVQLQFFEQAFRQYQEGAARLMGIGAHALDRTER